MRGFLRKASSLFRRHWGAPGNLQWWWENVIRPYIVPLMPSGFLGYIAYAQTLSWPIAGIAIFLMYVAILTLGGWLADVVRARFPVLRSSGMQGRLAISDDQSVPFSQLSDGRTIVNRTPEYLSGLFDEHTGMQSDKLVERYKGRWLRVSGSVRNVQTINEHEAVVDLSRKKALPIVSLYFSDKDSIENQLSILKPGDQVTVIGQIWNVGASILGLENCELEVP